MEQLLSPWPNPQVLNVTTRTVYLVGEVDEKMVARVIPALEYLDQTDGDIRLFIASEGGVENDGYAIYDAVTCCRNRVVAEVYGQCLSIAAAIFQGADVRRMSQYADFMIHNGSIGVDPEMKQDEVVGLAHQIERDSAKYYEILAQASGHPKEIISDWCREEKYFSAKEAHEAGFCDEIIKPLKKNKRRRRTRK